MTLKRDMRDRIKDDPEWEPTYVKKVMPSYKRMRKLFGVVGKPKLRGRGWTRPWKDTTKKRRKQAEASRRINRR